MRHQHDCDKCISLGEHNEYDLYYCEQGGLPTVIARFGPEGEYKSGMCFILVDPDLKEAARRATIRELPLQPGELKP